MSNIENKQTMATNILYYMTLKNKSRNDMCQALGVKYTTFTDWVKGNTYPRIDKIELMANYFGISKADLVEDRNASAASSRGVVINVLGRIAAGIPIEAVENIIDTEEITKDLARTGKFFGLRVQGDSMEPDIHNGDTVIVRQQEEAENDEIVIALINGNDGVCKRLKKYQNSIALVSLNANYEPMYFSQEETLAKPVKIIGKVVELRRKF